MTDLPGAEKDAQELLTYYYTKPDKILARETLRIFKTLSIEIRGKVIDYLTRHYRKTPGKDGKKLDITAIREAVTEVGGDFPEEFIEAIDWECDNPKCRAHFKYVVMSNDEWRRKKGLHDVCPHCGLSPADTRQARIVTKQNGGIIPDWYIHLQKECIRLHCGFKKKPHWDPEEDKKFEAMKTAETVKRMKNEVERVFHILCEEEAK